MIAAPGDGFAWARQASPGQISSGPLRLRGDRPAFWWMVSPGSVCWYNKKLIPQVKTVFHTPGLGSNIAGDAGRGIREEMRAAGFVEIPYDFAPDALAFGVPRSAHGGQKMAVYVDRYDGITALGVPAVEYRHAWERPLQLGHLVQWERDDDGRTAYLERALIEIANNGQPAHKAQIKLATGALVARIELEGRSQTPRAAIMVRSLVAHLPDEYHNEIRPVLDRFRIGQEVNNGLE